MRKLMTFRFSFFFFTSNTLLLDERIVKRRVYLTTNHSDNAKKFANIIHLSCYKNNVVRKFRGTFDGDVSYLLSPKRHQVFNSDLLADIIFLWHYNIQFQLIDKPIPCTRYQQMDVKYSFNINPCNNHCIFKRRLINYLDYNNFLHSEQGWLTSW